MCIRDRRWGGCQTVEEMDREGWLLPGMVCEVILGQTNQRYVGMCSMAAKALRSMVTAASPIRYDLPAFWDDGRDREAVDVLIRDMLALNPRCSEDQLRRGLRFFASGKLASWRLRQVSGLVLPESFGTVRVKGLLDLQANKLSALPQSFGEMQVGGSLDLSRNQLSFFPPSFSRIQVGQTVWLSENPVVTSSLAELPEGFRSVEFGSHFGMAREEPLIPSCPSCGSPGETRLE
eukprot:TRINITY_DN54855_c0_g1_i1.p1 TRINITY_DN54855_c0_g1~~TRINITY_DN54855_c0_g1_i1.p1  ORF type:complete len:234 (+),score=44.30 TRINITY_DN54855_c0_g1_i1:177-878(+)